jgi:hypothetical protein
MRCVYLAGQRFEYQVLVQEYKKKQSENIMGKVDVAKAS